MQEFDERKLFVRRKSKDGWNQTLKIVKYYIFVAIVGELRLKVIIKEIEGGQKNFHSVYPSWQVTVDDGGVKKKKFFTGEPEID